MHLIVPFAAPLAPEGRAVIARVSAPVLERLLGLWREVRRDDGDETDLTTPHEDALARALGWPPEAPSPWAARAAAADGIAVGNRAWGLLTPAHLHVGSDGVHLVDPAALALDASASRTLLDALRPQFEAEGYELAWGAPLRWYIAHEGLRDLRTASLDRVIGRNVEPWLPRQPGARAVRRLQNEAQMVLHDHPLNTAREGAGELPVNSVWLSGCGAALEPTAATADPPRLDDRLRAPALAGDWAAWREAWQTLDAQSIAPLLTAGANGYGQRLTLCGERNAVTFEPQAQSWGQRARSLFAKRAPLPLLLESL